ncbi:solute carrier family 23 member 2-like [Haliotis cracherodii]|uniref:solute carrier family 23 member 2-like n=1 Tax=Haliotis cracherodii TaxID=6455 RepID=UPI0039E8C83D
MIYSLSDIPPAHVTFGLAMQQVLVSISRCLSVTLVFAECMCAGDNELLKTKVLSSTMFVTGLTTFLMSTFGVRLPVFQGPDTYYLIPLLTMTSFAEWKCPTQESLAELYENTTVNVSLNTRGLLPVPDEFIDNKIQQLMGSLMLAGVIHTLIGATGLVGLLLRFIGPVTVVPAISLAGLFLSKVASKFSETHWGIAVVTAAIAFILSTSMSNISTPFPAWSRQKGFHLSWTGNHKTFAVLISMVVGWALSAILTVTGSLSPDPKNIQYYARTDSRTHVIGDSSWFSFPYPGQFGMPQFNAFAFTSFMMSTFLSIIDSIGDYSACARTAYLPPPPAHAVNRGISVEGAMVILAGGLGIGHGTSSYGYNISMIGLTKVSSRRVLQLTGVIFILLSIFTKLGAVFVTIPYSVLGGSMLILYGPLVGFILSNLQVVDLSSTRNVVIIGTSLFVGFMIPDWVTTRPDAIKTGNSDADSFIKILLSNPMLIGGVIACVLDNVTPGTRHERGLDWWEDDYSTSAENPYVEGSEVYDPLFIPRRLRRSKWARFIPVIPRHKQ